MLETSGEFVRCMERCGKSHSEDKMLFELREQSPVASLAPEQCPQAGTGLSPCSPSVPCRARDGAALDMADTAHSPCSWAGFDPL